MNIDLNALRAGRLTLDESRKLLRLYEDGLDGYTYLEKEVDASFMTYSTGQLRAPPPAASPRKTP